MSRLALLSAELAASRDYTERLLADIGAADWFAPRPEWKSTLAWQVGHLAVAEYGLAVERVRGLRPGDAELLPPEFRDWFGAQSVPRFSPQGYPPPEHILAVFRGVHQAAVEAVAGLGEERLDEPVSRSHPLFTTKAGSLAWCIRHEMLHAGQIGLLRRQLGHDPLW